MGKEYFREVMEDHVYFHVIALEETYHKLMQLGVDRAIANWLATATNLDGTFSGDLFQQS